LIFRDASQIIRSFGHQILTQQQITDENQKYEYKYKGISQCFSIMSKCLGGRYINFGVLWLYQDKAINEALDMTIQLMLSVPIDDLLVSFFNIMFKIIALNSYYYCSVQSYPKLALSFFHLLDELSREQLMSMPRISPEAFLYIIQACEQGVDSSDSLIRSHACSSIYNICSYVVKETEKAEREARHSSTSSVDPLSRRRSSVVAGGSPSNQITGNHWIMDYLRQFTQTLPSLLCSVFNLVLFDDNSDQWSLSRPLYVLMLLQREYAIKFTSAVIDQQLPERRGFVTTVSFSFFFLLFFKIIVWLIHFFLL
jgi:exportin-7